MMPTLATGLTGARVGVDNPSDSPCACDRSARRASTKGIAMGSRGFVVKRLAAFSTFSAEVATRLGSADFTWVVVAVSAQVAGSLLLTPLGFLTVRWLAGGRDGRFLFALLRH